MARKKVLLKQSPSSAFTAGLHLMRDCRDRVRARGERLDRKRRERIAGYTFLFFSEAVFYYFKPGWVRSDGTGTAPWSFFGDDGPAIPIKIDLSFSESKLTEAIDRLFHPKAARSLLAAAKVGRDFAQQVKKSFPVKGPRPRIPAALYAKWFEAILFPEDFCDWPEAEQVRPSNEDIIKITVFNFDRMGIKVDGYGVKKSLGRWMTPLAR